MRASRVKEDDSMPVKVMGQVYPSQTKILEGRTNISEHVFEALFKGVSTGFGQRLVEKVLRKHVLKGWVVLPKSSFGEHKIL